MVIFLRVSVTRFSCEKALGCMLYRLRTICTLYGRDTPKYLKAGWISSFISNNSAMWRILRVYIQCTVTSPTRVCALVSGASAACWGTSVASWSPTSCSISGRPTKFWSSGRCVAPQTSKLAVCRSWAQLYLKGKKKAISCLQALNQPSKLFVNISEPSAFFCSGASKRMFDPRCLRLPGSRHGSGYLRWAAALGPQHRVPAEDRRGARPAVPIGRPRQNVPAQPEDRPLSQLPQLVQQPPATRRQRHWWASCRYILTTWVFVLHHYLLLWKGFPVKAW